MQQRNGNSLNGFLLGLIVGVVITLLFTTRKGRQILRTLTQEGLHRFSAVEDILGELEKDDLSDEEWDGADEVISEKKKEATKSPSDQPALKRLTANGHKFFRKPSGKN